MIGNGHECNCYAVTMDWALVMAGFVLLMTGGEVVVCLLYTSDAADE